MNLNYNTYHTFEYDGAYYLFDNEKLISCIIEKHVYEALNQNDVTQLSEYEQKMFYGFRNQGIFFVDNPKKHFTLPDYNIVVISMALFHKCNLNCKYCFADAGENFKGIQRAFTEQSINAAIDFLLSDPYFANMDYYRINLVSGGEPLLNKKLFRTFIETAFRRFDQANKHLYVWFSTNGTLLSEEDLIFISKYNVGYGISLDGDKTSNDEMRIYKNGSGTYDDIIQNIKKIQSSPTVPKRLKELWGLMVYTQKNHDLLGNITHLRDLGFSTVQMRFVRSNDTALILDEDDTIDCITNYIREIFTQAINGDNSLLRLICNENDYIGKIIKRIVTQVQNEVRCTAGSHMFSFAADGNIYPCDCFVGNPDYIMGSFYKTMSVNHLEKYRDLSIHSRTKCKDCWARYVCGGDCYHNSYLKNGNIFTPDNSFCAIIIKVVESVIANINQYKLKHPEGYSAFFKFLQIREKMSRK